MKKHDKIAETRRPAAGLRFRAIVFFLMAVAAILSALVFAQGGIAAPAAMKTTVTNVHILYPKDIASNAGNASLKQEPSISSSKMLGCCENGGDHEGMSGLCQMSCPAHGCGLPGILASQSPAHTLLSVRYFPLAANTPNSLRHQRLNRPPIVDRLA